MTTKLTRQGVRALGNAARPHAECRYSASGKHAWGDVEIIDYLERKRSVCCGVQLAEDR